MCFCCICSRCGVLALFSILLYLQLKQMYSQRMNFLAGEAVTQRYANNATSTYQKKRW